MKKIFVTLFAAAVCSATALADGLTATLQQGEDMTPFYGVDAFKNAYAKADSGAVITLSAGIFNPIGGKMEKSLKIIGNFGMSSSSDNRTILSSLSINADNVTIDGIYFNTDVTLGKTKDCVIKHSWINGTLKYAADSIWHTNTVVDQCVVKNETAIKRGKNYLIKNSTIGKFNSVNTASNIAYITNCVVYDFVYNHNKPSSGLSGENYYPSNVPVAIYKNNVLVVDVTSYYYQYRSDKTYYYYKVYFSSPSEFYSNTMAMSFYQYSTSSSYYKDKTADFYFSSGCLNSNNNKEFYENILTSNEYPSYPKNPTLGQDGTVRGPRGGSGFSSFPNIPRIISKSIDSQTDATGKLNIKMTVKAE